MRPPLSPAPASGFGGPVAVLSRHRPGWRIRLAVRGLLPASCTPAVVALSLALHGCQSVPGTVDGALAQGLQVAEAALAADRPDLARQLYQSLLQRYPDAPAPRLRLARIAFAQGDFRFAHAQFVDAARLPLPPRGQAEAWFGAGRAALALQETAAATVHFQRARVLVDDPAEAAWIANGIAVAATVAADLRAADLHYREAVALDPSNARILANYVQMLAEAGQVEAAAQIYTRQPSSFWSEGDERRLRLLLQSHLSD